MANEIQRHFRLYVTHVDSEAFFLKLSGQLDQPSSLMLESLFEAAREDLEKGIGAVPASAIHEGIICAAKYKDGTYYRAKIINITNLSTGLVGVHFIDYGNKDIISLSTIRFLDSYDPMFLQLRGQATDYYLSGIMYPSGRWEETLLLKLQSLLCYAEYPAVIEAQTRTVPIISVQFKGNDLSTHLVQNRFGVGLPLSKQESLLHQLSNDSQSVSNWQPSVVTETASYPEHVPFLGNPNFPSNPASAMRLQQSIPLVPFNGTVPAPSLISQRLLVNKASRNPVNLRAPMRQPQQSSPSSSLSATPPLMASNKPPSPKKSITYKSRLLEVNSQHKVLVSYSEEGPEIFAVQLVADAKKLQDMMDDINKRPHSSLKEPPMIGTVCLGRMSDDRIICRAIVMNLSGSQCKLFFVDFGDTEMVSYYDIFDIPEEFVKPNVFAMRFCLSGVKKLNKGPHLNEVFKQLVNGKVMTLKVVAPEGPPLIQYGELYLDNKNLLDLLLANVKDTLQFKWLEMLPLGTRSSVLVSYVDSCIKFFIQLSDNIDKLNSVMDAVKVHCENTSSPGPLPVGAACCAKFPDDDNWYRARIKETKADRVVVTYVDYGNEQEINISDLRTISTELIILPAQSMKCALKGFQDKPVETKTSNQLEMLALEKTLMCHVVGVLSSDTMLVSLVDDTVNPPLDVARRMTQLSQPRSNIEAKATTPVRKDAPESFSSPESSVPDDNWKKVFRREKSFKDDRRPPRESNEEFNQRGGSFRSRENKDNFDRSGPGRHSEKFGGRPDRGDRRGGPKPCENNDSPPVVSPADPGNDEWNETATSSIQPPAPRLQSPPPREKNYNRDRRKPRNDREEKPDQRPSWKKESGLGKRLKQAAEISGNETQNVYKGSSVQDRLKRDSKFNKQDDWEENKSEDRGNKSWENRSDRRDNRGDRRQDDRRDNLGDKDRKENWNQKRDFRDNRGEREFRDNRGQRGEKEFRDNRGERGDRTRSNFTPRDRVERADRSFGSDSDKRSERSFRSQASDREHGNAPPYKSKSKFTQVQYKELPDPVPLEAPFTEPTIELGTQHEASVTWIISPANFYTQILSSQPKFLEMMHSIPEMYKGVKSFTGVVPVGASVLARYPADGVLYRATIVAVQPFSKFIVRYIDFGNKQLVDAKDLWQLDRQLMELPKMAVHCSLLGVAPKDGEWKSDPEIDLCFNAPRYQCIFQDFVEDVYKVSLWNNGVSVADMLIEKQLAAMSEQQSSATLKDEAIDLTIIVGQQILCKVTHVESFKKFYVQLDLDKASLVENAIAEYNTSLLTPLTTESLTEGIHCTVNYEGKIYRAILNDVADTSKITAVLPDYGKSITTTLENLMILPTELSVYYYQSLECCLNNYSAESKELLTAEELQQRLTGNKFIVYINNVEEITLVTTLYDVVTGKKIAMFEPDEGAYDEVVQLCTRAVFNYNFGMAYISHSENLNEIYLQKSSDTDKIARLLEELYKFYEEGSPEPLTSFEADELCAAKSSDGNWYRATILSSTETDVTVQFSDYGNTETILKESIKVLDPKFLEPCALALVVSLGLVALQEDVLTKLTEWTGEKDIQVTISFGTDGWLANLHLDGVDLSMKLVNEKLATPQITPTEEHTSEIVAEDPISLPEGCTQVYISHVDSPGQFWLQMADKIETIEEIQTILEAGADTYEDIENREMGTLCVAKYSADEQWYRAEILDSDSDITTVRFIDYGNTDVLDNQPGLIKVMPEHLKDIERYAVKSSVNAVPTGTGQWSEPASDYFTKLFGDFSTPVDALIVLKDVTTYVDVFINGQNMTDKLVSEGYATRSEEAECGDLPSCFASHVNSPSEFWIQLETATPELQAMENAMVDAENFPELTDKEEGVLCAAKYPEDGLWYRAQVIVDGSEGTEVLFMDYGNASIANELRSLPDDLKVKPALSRKCALQKSRDIKTWSRRSEVKFNELAAEGATIFSVQFIASGDISIVELYLDGKSVTEELVDLCEEQVITERPTPEGQETHKKTGKVAYADSLDEIYIHTDDRISDLDKIGQSLINAVEFEPVPKLEVDSLCATLWTEDELWYRGKILELTDTGYLVHFIDHGNKVHCEGDQIRQLPENLVSVAPVAKYCRVVGLEDVPPETKTDILAYLTGDNDRSFEIEFLDEKKEPMLVKFSLNAKDVCSRFIKDINTKTNTDKSPLDSKIILKDKDSRKTIADEKKHIDDSKNLASEQVTSDIQSGFCEETMIQESKKKESNKTGDRSEIITPNIKEETEKKDLAADIDDEENFLVDDLINELNTSHPDLDGSLDSTHTVIENKSYEANNEESATFEAKDDKIVKLEEKSIRKDDIVGSIEAQNDDSVQIEEKDDESSPNKFESDSLMSSDKDVSSETLTDLNDLLQSPERDDCKDSVITDTSYTSEGNIDTSLTKEVIKTIIDSITDETMEIIKDSNISVDESSNVLDCNKNSALEESVTKGREEKKKRNEIPDASALGNVTNFNDCLSAGTSCTVGSNIDKSSQLEAIKKTNTSPTKETIEIITNNVSKQEASEVRDLNKLSTFNESVTKDIKTEGENNEVPVEPFVEKVTNNDKIVDSSSTKYDINMT